MNILKQIKVAEFEKVAKDLPISNLTFSEKGPAPQQQQQPSYGKGNFIKDVATTTALAGAGGYAAHKVTDVVLNKLNQARVARRLPVLGHGKYQMLNVGINALGDIGLGTSLALMNRHRNVQQAQQTR